MNLLKIRSAFLFTQNEAIDGRNDHSSDENFGYVQNKAFELLVRAFVVNFSVVPHCEHVVNLPNMIASKLVEFIIFRGSELADVTLLRRMPNVEVLSLR